MNTNIGVSNFLSLPGFISEVNRIIAIIHKKFDKKHNRLALVTRTWLSEMTDEEHNKVYRKLINPVPIYMKNSIVEWNLQTVSKISYEFGEHSETLNIIGQVNKIPQLAIIKSQQTKINRMELVIDINTQAEVTDYRFDSNAITSFLEQAEKVEQDLRKQYIIGIENEEN